MEQSREELLREMFNTLIKNSDSVKLDKVEKLLEFDYIESTLKDYLNSGDDYSYEVLNKKSQKEKKQTGTKRVMSIPKVLSQATNAVIKKKDVKLETFKDYMVKLSNNSFDKILNEILFGNKKYPISSIKNVHAFMNSMYHNFYDITDGIGTTGAVAGKGEFLLIMLGGTKAPVGDVEYKRKRAEIKGKGASIAYSRQGSDSIWTAGTSPFRGISGYPDINQDLSESQVAKYFGRNNITDTKTLKNFFHVLILGLDKKYTSDPRAKKAISWAEEEFDRKFIKRNYFSTVEFMDILIKVAFESYLGYRQKTAPDPVNSVVVFIESKKEVISVTDAYTNPFVNSKYFTIDKGFPKSRGDIGAATKNEIIFFDKDGNNRITKENQRMDNLILKVDDTRMRPTTALLTSRALKNLSWGGTDEKLWNYILNLTNYYQAGHGNMRNIFLSLVEEPTFIWDEYKKRVKTEGIIQINEGLDISLMKDIVESNLKGKKAGKKYFVQPTRGNRVAEMSSDQLRYLQNRPSKQYLSKLREIQKKEKLLETLFERTYR